MQIFHRQTCTSRMRAFCRVDATHDTFHTSFNPILHLLVDMYLLTTHFSEKHCRLQTWRHKSFKLQHAKLTIVQKV